MNRRASTAALVVHGIVSFLVAAFIAVLMLFAAAASAYHRGAQRASTGTTVFDVVFPAALWIAYAIAIGIGARRGYSPTYWALVVTHVVLAAVGLVVFFPVGVGAVFVVVLTLRQH